MTGNMERPGQMVCLESRKGSFLLAEGLLPSLLPHNMEHTGMLGWFRAYFYVADSLKVPLALCRAGHGRPVWANLYPVCSYPIQPFRATYVSTETDSWNPRPRNIPENLASTISGDATARSQIKSAIKNPKLLMISDWFHYTSGELRNIALAADVDTL